MACSPACKKGTVFSVGTLLVLGSVLAALFWSDVSDYIYKTELSLSPTSTEFKMWRETPIPMYFEIYFFNWTNPEEVRTGKEKPRVKEVGPYTYFEKNTRVNITWNAENDTVTYRQYKQWHFLPSRSNGTPDDQIVTLNVMSATVANKVKNFNLILRRLVNVVLNVEESFAVKKSVRELLFDGYRDPILEVAAELKKIANISIPFDKFGWFYQRNMSYTYDGVLNMYTGQQNMSRLGNIYSWNYKNYSSAYDGRCASVSGSTGELLPPLLSYTKFPVFSPDLCGTITLIKTDEKVERLGVEGVKLAGDVNEFDNGTLHPEMSCFTPKGNSMPSGVRDMAACHFGAPAYVSYPHFLDADPWYTNSVDGLNPRKDQHEFYIKAEPNTGLPLEVNAQLQINILLQPIKGISMYEKVPKVVMPIFYFRQSAKLTPELGTLLKLLLNLSRIGTITFYGLAGIGVLLLVIGVAVTLRGNWGDDDEKLSLIPAISETRRKNENGINSQSEVSPPH